VKAANGWATLLGLATLLRVCASAYAGQVSFGVGLLFGCLLLGLFWYCGMSLLDRSRWAFVAIIVLSTLPVLGILAAAVHLLRLLVEHQADIQLADGLVVLSFLCQMAVTCVLFRYLLAAETRNYIWTQPAQPIVEQTGQAGSGPPSSGARPE
jgi:hypothetical protein